MSCFVSIRGVYFARSLQDLDDKEFVPQHSGWHVTCTPTSPTAPTGLGERSGSPALLALVIPCRYPCYSCLFAVVFHFLIWWIFLHFHLFSCSTAQVRANNDVHPSVLRQCRCGAQLRRTECIGKDNIHFDTFWYILYKCNGMDSMDSMDSMNSMDSHDCFHTHWLQDVDTLPWSQMQPVWKRCLRRKVCGLIPSYECCVLGWRCGTYS